MRLVLVLSFAFPLPALAGCSAKGSGGGDPVAGASANEPTDAGPSDATAKGSKDANEIGKDSGVVATDDAGADTDDRCAQMATLDTCGLCCGQRHPTGALTYRQAVVSCVCTPSLCQTDCATTGCAASYKNPDATCNACLYGKGQQACFSQVYSACNPDPDCSTFLQCLMRCPQK